jgi:flavin reductase (DIM6/NTAB) family NADH-FMN oxidoreductase RutF
MQPVAADEFIAAMGRHVSSVCVITTTDGRERFGLTATAVSSVSANPPRLLVCVNASGLTHAKIVAAGILCVNVVGEDQDKVARSFAGMLGRDFDRFSVGTWETLKTGAPVLAEAVAAFDCRVTEQVQQATHTIFVCEVVATAQGRQEPLLYGSRRFRQLRKSVASRAVEEPEMDSLHFW